MNEIEDVAGEAEEALTVGQVIAAYDSLLNDIANNDRKVIRRLLAEPTLTDEARRALGEWAERVEALTSHFMLENYTASGSA